MNRNVVLLPDAPVRDYAITLSHKIAKKHKTSFILDGKNFYPHVTLYQAAYPEKNLGHVEKRVAAIAQSEKKFLLEVKGCSGLLGFVFLDVLLTAPLQKLHTAVVSSLNELREGVLMDSVKSLLVSEDIPEKMKDSIRSYGSPLAMDAYLAHITLCHLQNSEEREVVCASLGKVETSFAVDALHVTNIGIAGTVNKFFASYKFS